MHEYFTYASNMLQICFNHVSSMFKVSFIYASFCIKYAKSIVQVNNMLHECLKYDLVLVCLGCASLGAVMLGLVRQNEVDGGLYWLVGLFRFILDCLAHLRMGDI